jgi:ribosome recycling factor
MTEELKPVFDTLQEGLDKAITHAKQEFNKIRAGKAMPSMLDSVTVDYYGSHVPLSQVANISTPDARTIMVQPWEKSLLQEIEKAITTGNLGFNPQNDGEQVIISVPVLTEERRVQLVKRVKIEAEQAKIGLRSARKDANEAIKKLKNDGLSEDMAKTAEADVQKQVDGYSTKIDGLVSEKEGEILKV